MRTLLLDILWARPGVLPVAGYWLTLLAHYGQVETKKRVMEQPL
jgi:hypothetical protein